MTRVALALATGLYSGYAPVAPGTVGSAVGLVVLGAVRVTGSVAGCSPFGSLSPITRPGWMPPPAQTEK